MGIIGSENRSRKDRQSISEKFSEAVASSSRQADLKMSASSICSPYGEDPTLIGLDSPADIHILIVQRTGLNCGYEAPSSASPLPDMILKE